MNENLIAVNVPNGVSILIMALVGGVLVSAVRKFAKRKTGAVTTGPAFSG